MNPTDEVWIGMLCLGVGPRPDSWSIQGIFSSSEKAYAACGGPPGTASGLRSVLPIWLDVEGGGPRYHQAVFAILSLKLQEMMSATSKAAQVFFDNMRSTPPRDVESAVRKAGEANRRVREIMLPPIHPCDEQQSSNGQELWIVFGRAGIDSPRIFWSISGVFTTRDNAARVCVNDSFLMAPVRLDQSGAEKADGFPGAERPGMRPPPG